MGVSHDKVAELERIFPGDSEMARRMRVYDWAATPLGPPQLWPQNLHIALGICLSSLFPMHLWWGPSMTLFYNDAYISFLGPGKHPAVLGGSGRDAWAEIWHTIGPMIEQVFTDGIATWSEDMMMFIDRALPEEEIYVTFSFSPVSGSNHTVDGMFCACTETTAKIIGNRRLETLRLLAVEGTVAHSVDEAVRTVADVLAQNPYDLPFAAVYLVDADDGIARLAASAGVTGERLPQTVGEPGAGETAPASPLYTALHTGQPVDLDKPGKLGFAGGPWAEPVTTALALPIRTASHEEPCGLLVAGASTRRPLDAGYRSFLDMVACHVATTIADARVYEEERTRAEALAKLDLAKTAFFSNVSHEFRTPLTLLLGPLEDELRRQPDSESLRIAHRNSLRLLKLVNTLLDFSRIEAGRIEAVYEPVDLSTFTADLASVFRSAFEKAGLDLLVNCLPLSEPAWVDRDMWEKIVLNLLSNAFKFTFEGGAAVTLRERGSLLELRVADTGVGIPTTELPHIFERFHRVRDMRSRTHEGTGIGLALVHELAHLHGGEVRAHSVEGHGSTFTVTIPRGKAHLPQDRIGAARRLSSTASGAESFVEEALRWLPHSSLPDTPDATDAAAHPPEGPAQLPARRGRILLADDNADMRNYVARLLADQHEVIAVADGEAALAAVRDSRPDLVLADVMMPRLDGYGLLRALRADPETSGLPIILLSARAGEEARVEGLEGGADDYLIKPFSARELMVRVRTHLELAWARNDSKAELEDRVRERTDELTRAYEALRDSETRYHTLFDSIDEGFCIIEVIFDDDDRAVDYRFLEINPAFAGQAGLRDAQGKRMRELAPEHEEHWFETYGTVATSGEPVRFEKEARALRRWYDVYAFRVGNPALRRVALIFKDITARKQAEQGLERSQDEFRRLAENSPDVIARLDRSLHLLYVSPAIEKISGVPAAYYAGKSGTDLRMPPDVFRQWLRAQRRALERGEQVNLQFDLETPDGVYRSFDLLVVPERDASGEVETLLNIARDVTMLKQGEAQLQFLATHDALTALPNRAFLHDRLHASLARAQRVATSVALLYVDLDHFKPVNDSLGHEVGDELLQSVAARLTSCVRKSDIVARLGGDEFAILLDDIHDPQEAGWIAGNLIASLSRPFLLAGQHVYISASVGIACSPDDGKTAETLLRHADTAMYKAKDEGKNDYRFFSKGMDSAARDKLFLSASLRNALERNELALAYQPRVDTVSGEIVGVEALIRWHSPERGLVLPSRFVGLAEETGIIEPIGEWAIRTACQQLARWRLLDPTRFCVAVNISARQFRQPKLAERIAAILAETGVQPASLELEVTESVVMANPEKAKKTLAHLAELGIHLALDDFGTGHSSLAYLQRFPVHRLKIDQSFVRDLPDSKEAADIARAIMALAASLGLAVTAEGVETVGQREFLRQAGCETWQGYLFSRPVDADLIPLLMS